MRDPRTDPRPFAEFRAWLYEHGHGHYLDFDVPVRAERMAQGWFEDELGQG